MAKHERIGTDESSANKVSETSGRHADGFSYRGDNEDEYPDALTSLEPQDQVSLFHDEEPLAPAPGASNARHGKQDENEFPPLPPQSRRMRKILIALIVLVFLALILLGVLMGLWMQESKNVAEQQATDQQQASADAGLSSDATDESDSTEKVTEVPDLVSLLGMKKSAVLEALGSGASVTRTTESGDDDDQQTTLTISLAEEPSDSNSGTPTVYVTLSSKGKVIKAGYSAATELLGYGSLSFEDAIVANQIIESTLSEAGVEVDAASIELPEDRSSYTTYTDDGETVLKENCTFEGTAEVDGEELSWSARLLYDYTSSISSGDLSDTIRYVYVYVGM